MKNILNNTLKHWAKSRPTKDLVIPTVDSPEVNELQPTNNVKDIPVFCIQRKEKCNKKKLLKYAVGIITAFSPEIVEFLNKFTKQFDPVDIAGRRFYRGILSGKLVTITVCGIGMTNSAMTTQLMIDYFDPTYLFFSGIAGGMNVEKSDPLVPGNDRRIGDVIINARWAEYQHQKFIRNNTEGCDTVCNFIDFGVDFPNNFYRIVPALNRTLAFTRPDCEGCEGPEGCGTCPPVPGLNPGENGGIINGFLQATEFAIPMEVEVLRTGDDYLKVPVPQQFYFQVDSYLLDLATTAINAPGFVLPIQIESTVCAAFDPDCGCTDFQDITYQPVASIGDLGVAASTFVDNAIYRQMVFDEFAVGGVVVETVDMETPAFAHVAASNNKPFIRVSSLSDLAGGDVGINVILDFIAQAAVNSAYVTTSIIALIPANADCCNEFVTGAQKFCKKKH